MEILLEQAYQFLKDHPDINEVELTDGDVTVRLVRFSPVPITYSGYSYPSTWYEQTDPK